MVRVEKIQRSEDKNYTGQGPIGGSVSSRVRAERLMHKFAIGTILLWNKLIILPSSQVYTCSTFFHADVKTFRSSGVEKQPYQAHFVLALELRDGKHDRGMF